MATDAIAEFFRESKRVPFEQLPTSLMVGTAMLGPKTNINVGAVFANVPIYEIPNWERGTKKEVTIPYPNIPYVVLSAKRGLEIRGIVKNLNDLKKKEKADGNKGKFPNQVALDVSLRDKVVNVMIFGNSLKIAGAQKAEQLAETFIFIRALFCYMQSQGIKVFDEEPILKSLDIAMENVVFDLGFRVRGDVIKQKALEAGLESSDDAEAARVQYHMGIEKTKGGSRYHDFRIRHTGKVTYCGNNRAAMKPYYEKFMDFISQNEADIRFC